MLVSSVAFWAAKKCWEQGKMEHHFLL